MNEIMVMDIPNREGKTLTSDELKKLRDAGCSSCMTFMNADLDLHQLEDWIFKVVNAGLHALFFGPKPRSKPEWQCVGESGKSIPGSLSIWNPAGRADYLFFLDTICEAFSGPEIEICNGWYEVGETMYLNEPACFDSYAIDDYQRMYSTTTQPVFGTPECDAWLKASYFGMYTAIQNICTSYTHTKRIWSNLHRSIATYTSLRGNGCKWIGELYAAYRQQYPDYPIYGLYFTYYPHGSWLWDTVEQDVQTYGLQVYTGAEYCEGIVKHAQIAKQYTLRGMLVAPTHPFTPHVSIEPWMIQAIQQARIILF